MSPNQRAARLTLAVIGVTLLLYMTAVPLLAWCFHQPLIMAAGPASGVFGLLGLIGLGRRYYQPVVGQTTMMDERDKRIEERSRIIGFSVFWVVWVIGSVGAWALLRYVANCETIPVETLPMLVVAGFLVFMMVQSVSILAQYGWSGHNDPT